MIKIQNQLDHDEAVASDKIATLLAEHWAHLNPTKVNGEPTESALTIRCKDLADKLGSADFNDKEINAAHAKAASEFLGKFVQKDFALLKELIIASPVRLREMKTEFDKELPDGLFWENTEKQGIKQTALGLLLSRKVFRYDAFRSSRHCTALFGSEKLNLKICPYCNLDSTYVAGTPPAEDGAIKKRAYFHIDHFYAKVKYPFFAVSFFNLIPSCDNCNALEKGTKDFEIETHVHPYHRNFDDVYAFGFDWQKLAAKDESFLTLDIKTGMPSGDQTATDLNIIGRHNAHTEGIRKMIEYHRSYSARFLHDPDPFRDHFLGLFPEKREDILKHRQAKVFRDIFSIIHDGSLIALT
ncbi:hypothetical protein B7R77_12380 [Ralstonia solanacearum K60]|uniref:HNH nuclease domain-containing protein n=1 Tax=Ralstonia solanacearum K60 TaxID=1091042 RepID=A0AAP7ZP36_RALSL|nr:hypothetical protein [Ralstonia solanacearum]OYQ13963.1 hypothetical protein B7R77_12380 [Ralstonia solanacearum K60]CCF98290.1 hypothetical protein RSK60_480004 [Ralstonia solanacearum K60]